MNDLHPPKDEHRRFQFSLRTLLLLVMVGGIGTGLLGRMALDLVSKDERRTLVLGAPLLLIVAFFLVAASYAGTTKRDRVVMQLLYGLFGVFTGTMISLMLCLDGRRAGDPLIWAPVAAIVSGLIVILEIRFLWWCRDRVDHRWWIVGAASLLLLIMLVASIGFYLLGDEIRQARERDRQAENRIKARQERIEKEQAWKRQQGH